MIQFAYWALELTLMWVAFKSRRHALMVLVFSLPLSRRLPALPISLLNYQNLILVIVVVSCMQHTTRTTGQGKGIRHWVLLFIMSVLFTASFMNTVLFFEPNFYPALWNPYRNLLAYRALMLCFAMYAIVSFFIRDREDLLAVVKAAVAGIVVEGGYTSFEFLVLRPGRASGHMAEPNSMGSFLACSFVLVFGLMVLLPRAYPRWKTVVAGTAVSAVGLLGTLSRGAWIAGLAGFAVVAGWVSKRALVIGIVILSLSSLWLPEKVQERLNSTFIKADQQNWKFRDGAGVQESALLASVTAQVEADEGSNIRLDTSLQGRLVIWDAALKMMRDYPLGVGFGVFPWFLHNYSSVLRWKASHNIYIKVGTEAGFPTLVTFLLMIGVLCGDCIRAGRMKDDMEIRAFGVSMFGYIVALAISAFGVDVFFQVDVNGQFWCLAAAASQAALYPAVRKVADEEPPPQATGARPLYELVK